jgi:enoyl-CoA hydratase
MANFQFITTSIQNNIGMVELNRPKQYNSLNRQMVREIVEAFEEFEQNEFVRVIVISGKGKAFS